MAHLVSRPAVYESTLLQLQACASSQMSMYHTLYPHDLLVQVCRAVAQYIPLPPVPGCFLSEPEIQEIRAPSNGHTTSCDQQHTQKLTLPQVAPSKHHDHQSRHPQHLVGVTQPASSSS